ncbi:MAG TPA: hypothetical protein VJ910_10990, partial [Desulfuromonadales bacterium]|nr:hypothetical protein [Desulfuromonadales bacterium]
MTRLFIIIILSLLAWPFSAMAETRLMQVERGDSLDSLRLKFTFNEIPDYEIEESGQRVDVILKNTVPSPDLRTLKEDGRLIKVIFAQKTKDLVVSLLLRQVPARALIQPKASPSRLLLDLFWEQNPGRPAIAFRIAGLPTPRAEAATAEVRPASRYAGQWQQFFKDYFLPIDIPGSLQLSLTAWPPLSDQMVSELPSSAARKIAENDWAGLLKVLEKPEPGLETGRDHQQAVLRSEALLRSGEPEQALVLLTAAHKNLSAGSLKTRATMLMSYLQAADGAFYRANNLLAKAQSMLKPDAPLRPYGLLLGAEIALAIGQPATAVKILASEGEAWPDSLKNIRERRLYEGKVGMEEMEQALKYYRSLENLPEAFAGET